MRRLREKFDAKKPVREEACRRSVLERVAQYGTPQYEKRNEGVRECGIHRSGLVMMSHIWITC
jgi:hypothetical protein